MPTEKHSTCYDVRVARTRTMKRGYKFRFYPTPKQEAEFTRTWGCTRFVYNKALQLKSESWSKDKTNISYEGTSKELTKWKRDPETTWLKEVSSVPLQQALRHLNTAYQNFFDKRSAYPRFKARKRSKLSLTYISTGFGFEEDGLHLAKLAEPLNVTYSRDFDQATVSRVTISRDAAHRWFVSILCESAVTALPKTGKQTGIDLGVKDLAVLADGDKLNFDKERISKKQQEIVKYQRRLSRKQLGSVNREKAKIKLARKYAALTDYRRDFLHKLTTMLVSEYDFLAIENLNVKGMSTKGKGSRKRGLNRGIRSNLLGQFRVMLEYKADWYGKQVIAINRWFPSSKTCHKCQHVNRDLKLSDRKWDCPGCGAHLDRDINAAINILAAGLAVIVCGEASGELTVQRQSRSGVLVEAGRSHP